MKGTSADVLCIQEARLSKGQAKEQADALVAIEAQPTDVDIAKLFYKGQAPPPPSPKTPFKPLPVNVEARESYLWTARQRGNKELEEECSAIKQSYEAMDARAAVIGNTRA